MMARTKKSHQHGSVFEAKLKTGEKVFRLVYRERTANGWKQKVETLHGLASKKAAMKKLEERLAPINAANGGEAAAVTTFDELVDRYWKSFRANVTAKPSTVYCENSLIENHIRPFFHGRTISEIVAVDVTTFMEGLSEKKLSKQYRKNIFVKLKQMFAVAVENDLLLASPVRRIHRPSVERTEKPTISIAQARQLLKVVEPEWRALLVTLMFTGLRAGELLALTWANVDFPKRRIHVVQSLWRGKLVPPKTKASVQLVAMPKRLVSELRQHKSRSQWKGADDFVFCRVDGKPIDPDSFRRYGIYPALAKAGIPRVTRASGCHLFRHLVGSIVHRQTGSVKLAQQQLRHSTIATTGDIYTHVDAPEMDAVADLLGKAFGASGYKTVIEAPQAAPIIE